MRGSSMKNPLRPGHAGRNAAQDRKGAGAEKDAALILLLKPGIYTKQVQASQNGEVLFET